MLAQRNEYIKIDSIEIDGVAANQAKENIAATIWASNINTIVGDARHLTAIHKYDLIITNPPFFKNSLQSPTVNKNLARHSNTLSNTDLLNIANTHITETGYFAILLPLPEYLLFETFFITNGWYLVKKISIKHTQNALVKRVIGLFTRIPNRQAEEELLIIYNEDKTYTTHFKDLMSPFYLNL